MSPRLLAAGALAVLVPVASVVSPTDAIAPLPPAYEAAAVHVQGDGKTLIAYVAPHSKAFNLLRLRTDGSFDPSFGGDGIVETTFDGNTVVVSDVAVQPDGRIVAVGEVLTGGLDSSFAVARYWPDGSLDATFGGDGTVVTDFGSSAAGLPSIALGPGGAIVAAAMKMNTTAAGVLIARYRSDGSADPTFDQDGKLELALPGDQENVTGVAFDQSGRAVIVGSCQLPGSHRQPFLLRFLADGQLDPTFGFGGFMTVDHGVGNEWANGLAIQPDGRIVTAGAASGTDFVVGYTVVSRFLPTGLPDPAFGSGGHVLIPAESTPPAGLDVALLRDGRIAVSGNTKFGDADVTLTILTAAGAADSAFGGGDGVHQFDLGPDGHLDQGGELAPTRNGKLIVVGTYRAPVPFPEQSPTTLGLAAIAAIDP